jgi:uncharacterized membrane protein YdjX (TVP38/TMEM64 family)
MGDGGTTLSPERPLKWDKTLPPPLTIVWGLVIAGLIALYFLALKHGIAGQVMEFAQDQGFLGVVVSTAIMALFSAIPVPSEFISVLLMQEYGVWLGALLSWLGGVGGAVAGLYLAEALARPLVTRLAAKYLKLVEPWLEREGVRGLLLARFLPLVPYHVLNYAGGILGVPLVPFVWTTAVGTLPFQVGLAAVYAGFRYGSLIVLGAGGAFLILLVVLGSLYRRRWLPAPDRE